jgi:subtilase family serine protease
MGFDHSGNNPDDCGLSDASPCRAVPDVSGDADPRNSLLVFGVACGLSKDQSYAGWEGFGGTSFASPQWAALAALIDEGIPGSRAGLLSPALYAVARTDPSAFIDVTQGNNDSLTNNNSFGIDMGDYTCGPSQLQPCYLATPGYDTATGLGIPVGAVLATDIQSLDGGECTYFGSLGGTHLNAPIVGMASTPDGHGYWLVASDGGIFSFT